MKLNFCHAIIAAFLVCDIVFVSTANGLTTPQNFDQDGNGLLSEIERKAQLDFLAMQFPEVKQREFVTVEKGPDGKDVSTSEFKETPFDADNDGKVTLEEMTEGRHPITQVMRESFLKKPASVIWTIDSFPEWLMTTYFQDTATVGPITEFASAGIGPRPATQTDAALAPVKRDDKGGILFPANSGAFLRTDGYRDTRWDWRWMTFIFRIDGNSGDASKTELLGINKNIPGKNNVGGKYSPRIGFEKPSGFWIEYSGIGEKGAERRRFNAKNLIADGKTWNVLVAGIRQGRVFASLNGVEFTVGVEQPSHYSGEMIYDSYSIIGDETNKKNSEWALDALVFGQSEISEAMVQKLSGWGAWRCGDTATAALPAAHPYKRARPMVDAEDFPRRYYHREDKWDEFLAANTKEITRGNIGGERVVVPGFERVFIDDFRAKRIAPSRSGEDAIWYSYGYNAAVGGGAPLVYDNQQPDAYPHDEKKQQQTVSLVPQPGQQERWRGSALYTVNNCSQGYVWSGPKVFRIRCMFPKEDPKTVAHGLFPAFWSYGTEWQFWRTSNRIENDWWEFDSVEGFWMNGMSTHFHYPHVKSIFPKTNDSYKRTKIFGAKMTEDITKIPGGIYVWDGQWHTWEYIVDNDWTYVNVSVETPGSGGKINEKWYELWRCRTAPTYLEPQNLIFCFALKEKNQGLVPGKRYDFVADYIEVLQKTSDIEKVPAPFTARPTLTITGSIAKCVPNLKGVTDIRYYWFADSYPLTYGASDTLTIPPEYARAQIRCMVKAVGALDQPEAWTR